MKINLLLIALLVLFVQASNDVNAQANSFADSSAKPSLDAAVDQQKSAQGEIEMLAESLSSPDVGMKKKPVGSLQLMKIDEKGRADFGVVPAGEYVVTLIPSKRKSPGTTHELAAGVNKCKSNLKTCQVQVIIEGTESGILNKVYEPKQVWQDESPNTRLASVADNNHGVHFKTNGRSRIVVTLKFMDLKPVPAN